MADCSGDCFRYRRHGAVVVMSSHFRLLLVVATTLYVAGFSSIACHPMTSESNELHQRDDGPCARFASSDEDCEQFYSCLSHHHGCSSIRHSIAGHLCRQLNSLQHQRQQLDGDVLLWAQRTNRCVVERIARQFNEDETVYGGGLRRCSDSDFRIRSAAQWCAQQSTNFNETCRTVLWDGRHAAMTLVTRRNWMWLVETMRSCPRHIVNRFIKWVIVTSSVAN